MLLYLNTEVCILMKKRGLSGQSLISIEPLCKGPLGNITSQQMAPWLPFLSLPITEGSQDKNLKETLLFGLLSFRFYTTQDCPCRGKEKEHIHPPQPQEKVLETSSHNSPADGQLSRKRCVEGLETITTWERMRTLAKIERNNKLDLGEKPCYPFAECVFTLTGPECSTQDSP